jgi:hypothetical protein
MEHPAFYLAQRVRATHSLSYPATIKELLAVCRQRGVPVLWSANLQNPGYYSAYDRAIVMKVGSPPAILAHELAHFLLDDAEGNHVLYTYPEFFEDPLELACELFAWVLCGEQE